ncbi:MAG: hypothetical protein V7637_4330 [Mycobacteriales bacterium]|jgi:DNA-binding SARP family transcriptional activator/tetratricopeptide (TPR) repeat protein
MQGARFLVLGPLEVTADGRAVEVAGPRVRVVLALLVAGVGRVVSVDALVDALWGQRPPPDARHTVRAYVALLRKALRSAAGAPGGESVMTRSPGYLLRVAPDAIDAARFQQAAAAGRQALAAGRPADAAAQLAAALELWRGPAYVEFADTPALRAESARLDQLRLAALVDRIDADLAAGAGAQLVAELDGLTAQHPGNERLWGQLMTALYRAGRPADALAVYRRAREAIVDGFGLEPSPGLTGIHQQILAQDAALLAAGPSAAVGGRAPRPAQLPAGVAAFTGRHAELADLDALLPAPGAEPGAAVISLVSGTAGVGKTALALRWAHRAADRFPSGQLYVDLRGYDAEAPVPAADALAGFLVALGVAAEDIPLGLADRAASYRTRTAGRRLLVVLDNAGSVEQVAPLLPGTPAAAVVVTSRDSLAGLVARHGARRLALDPLPAADAVALLRELIGERVDRDPGAAIALADLCARLPLALRIAAELAGTRRGAPLPDLVGELGDQHRRLDLLDAGGDRRTALAAVFSWSVRHLPTGAARMFQLAGLHPGANLDVHAGAALAGFDLQISRRTLDLLARAHLLHLTGAGRFGMHDLLRAYAGGLAAAEHAGRDRRAALGRLFDYYLWTAAAAMGRLHPAEQQYRPRLPLPTTPVPALPTPAAALAWLDAERPTLVLLAAHAVEHGRPEHAVLLSDTLSRYLAGGHYTDALAVYGSAIRAAQRTGDRAGEANAHRRLAAVQLRLGGRAEAVDGLQRATALYRSCGDLTGEAYVLIDLGNVEGDRCYRSAVDYHRRALTLFQRAGDPMCQARALVNLGSVERRLGRYELAIEHHQQAQTLLDQIGDVVGAAWTATSLGDIDTDRGSYQTAANHQLRSLALFEQAGDRIGAAWARTGLGDAQTGLGRPDRATEHHRSALADFRDTGHRPGEAWALNGLGDAARAAGRPAVALRWHTDALTVATQIDARDEQARAHAGLGHAHHTLANLDLARQHWQQALARYADLGAPQADGLRAQLTALNPPA